jgi:D-tyrosyl-tRNA(Tyr) deacylase
VRVVVQRVKSASVTIEHKVEGKIDAGLMILVGVAETDSEEEVMYIANKCAHLRIFEDEQGKMNTSLLETGGSILAISQFTLLADTRKGRRPSFIKAAAPDKGNTLYLRFVRALKEMGIHVETGIFGAMMDVELINNGPVTIIIDTNDIKNG